MLSCVALLPCVCVSAPVFIRVGAATTNCVARPLCWLVVVLCVCVCLFFYCCCFFSFASPGTGASALVALCTTRLHTPLHMVHTRATYLTLSAHTPRSSYFSPPPTFLPPSTFPLQFTHSPPLPPSLGILAGVLCIACCSNRTRVSKACEAAADAISCG